MTADALDIAFAPVLPWWLLASAGLLAGLPAAFAVLRRIRGGWLRAALTLLLVAALARPSLIAERREAERDVAAVLVDVSPSQSVGDRPGATEAALAVLRERFDALSGPDVLIVETDGRGPRSGPAGGGRGTMLFDALRTALAGVPRHRRAGAVLVTDGRIHDPENAPAGPDEVGPVHFLLTGDPDRDGDRRLAVASAPSYGIVGQNIEARILVEDLGPGGRARGSAEVTVTANGRPLVSAVVPLGEPAGIPLPITHAGPNLFEFSVGAGPIDPTPVNNRAVVEVAGVRDRLRVLLLSGRPHAGERVWRNLLKSDPAVDLVHFTILRPPHKQDRTPIRELSLIAFPVRELFEEKLGEFDLIVFDRYARRSVIPPMYFRNIADYVRGGGALLDAAGPAFSDSFSTLYRTALGELYPGAPTGNMLEEPFRPLPTALGRRHPVTSMLVAGEAEPRWGRWLRQVEVDPVGGMVLMSGARDRPLLLLNRVGEGRVGLLASDQVWLWARGYQGGGPHGELLRRLAHWLMREPDLEEDALTARFVDGRLEVERRSVGDGPGPVVAVAPDGERFDVGMTAAGAGRWRGTVAAPQSGIWRVDGGAHEVVAGAGAADDREYADLRPAAAPAETVAAATGGRAAWLGREGVPEVRLARPDGRMAGRGWIGLRDNRAYRVTGVERTALLPGWLVLLLAAGLAGAAWRREGGA